MARDEDRQRGAVSAESDGGGLSGVIADLSLAVGQMRDQMKQGGPPVPWEACHPVWFTGNIPLTSGSGSQQQNNAYGPNDPYWWDLRTLSVWGMTGTSNSLTVYRNSSNGEQILEADGNGQITWSSQILLSPRDQLVFSASSVTGNIYFVGVAIEIQTAWLPAYLM